MNPDLTGHFLDRAEQALRFSNGNRRQSEASFLQQLMSELGVHAPGFSPAMLFRSILCNCSSTHIAYKVLEVLAKPLQRPKDALRPGDWMLRAVPGTGDVGHVSVLVSNDLLTLSSLSYEGIAAEGAHPGYYGIVIEAGAFPHTRKESFARRFLDSRGRVPAHSIILRPQSPDSDPPEEYQPSTGFKIEQRDPSRSGEPYLDLEAADSTITREAEHKPGLLREDAAEDNFDPATIPKEVAEALSRKDWRRALELAIRAGWHDENDLTDLLFFTRHPELPTPQLDPKNPKFKPLTAEWTAILAGEARPAIERASVDDTLKVPGNYVAERDRQFWGATGKKFRDLVEWAAGEVDINPGLLAAVLLAEWDKSWVYLSSGEVVTFLSGTDDFFEERAQLAANVPAFAQVHFDITKKTTNRNEAGRLVTTIPFNSGRDAALATAVYLKNGEIKVRKGAEKNGGDFDKLPAETRFALVRIAMAAGHGWISPDGTLVRAKWEVRKDGTAGCVRLAKGEKGGILCGVAARLEKVLAGKDILVRKNEPRQYPDTAHQTDRNATILTAQALHLSDWIFGKPLTAASQPAVPTSETWNTTQESVGEEAPTLSRAHPVASAALITAGCPDDAQLRQPLQLTEHCLNRLEGMHVAVVGGGLAGLMAARRLREHRVKVTLFEARVKVGGRVLSSDTFSNGRMIELGAELIGSFHTRCLALARHYGLAMIGRMSEELYERSGLSTKLTLDKPLCMDEIRSLDEQMESRALRPIAHLAQKIVDPSQPWKEDPALQAYDNTPVAKYLETDRKIDRRKDDRLWKMIEHLLVNDEVASLDEMNFLGLLCKVRAGQGPRFGTKEPNLMGYWTELEIFRCADGCEALAKSMAKEIQTDEGTTRQRVQFQLSTAVKGIDISKQGVTLRVQPVQSNLKLADGAPIPVKQLYDYVILTIPPSVWDGVTVKVDGREASLKAEIGVMGMGPAVKFFSDVKTRFWIAEKAAPYGGSLELGQVWEGTDNQTQVDNQGVVLSVFAGPIVGRKRVPTKDECVAGLKRLYPGYSGNLLKAHYSDWPNEPFIKTGYASPTGGQVVGIGKKLSEPFHDRMFFGGEHTQMDFFGYMEGALRSGERAAETIINQECGLNKAPEHFVASRETFAGASK